MKHEQARLVVVFAPDWQQRATGADANVAWRSAIGGAHESSRRTPLHHFQLVASPLHAFESIDGQAETNLTDQINHSGRLSRSENLCCCCSWVLPCSRPRSRWSCFCVMAVSVRELIGRSPHSGSSQIGQPISMVPFQGCKRRLAGRASCHHLLT